MSYKDEIRVKSGLTQKDVSLIDTETLVAILDNVYKGVVCVDTEGRITFLSRSNEKFYNLQPGEAVGKHVTEIIKNSRLHIVAKTGKPEVGMVMRVKDNDYRVVERIPIKKGGKVVGAIGKIMFDDIEKVKALSERIAGLEKKVLTYRKLVEDFYLAKYKFSDIIGVNTILQNVKNNARKAARTSSNILIAGESGTGKELFAHAIHNSSTRRKFPFVRVNCAAIPHELFESELFGYAKGAFTGAKETGKKGQFQLADHGTIFLDEISEMPIYMQAKLLRVLQEREILRIGDDKPIPVDFRLIASTNKDLNRMIADGGFREDLFYRLNVVKLTLPPLRKRMEDLDILVAHFFDVLNTKLGTKVTGLSGEARHLLHEHDWRGNVRELRNVLERSLNICHEGELDSRHLVTYFHPESYKDSLALEQIKPLRDTLLRAERGAIQRALEITGGNKKEAAKLLGISRSGLYQKMSMFDISI